MNPTHLHFEIKKSNSDFKKSELLNLYELDLRFFPTPWDLSSWENIDLDSDNLLIILKKDDAAIGFSLLSLNRPDNFAHLLKILIHPDHQDQKLASFLLSKTLSMLNDMDVYNVYLEVNQSNESAIALYKKLGFKIIHSKKDYYGTNQSAHIMTNFNQ